MAEPVSPARRLLMRAAFIGLALLVMFVHLLPLNTQPRPWAPPDLIVAFAFAWSLRRPDFVPILSIAAVMLTADLMLQRPPGLWALLVVLGCEYLKTRTAGLRESGFAGEWLAVCLTLAAITVANRVVLALLGVPQAQLGLSLIQMLATMAIYPAVVFASQTLMGVRKPAPGDSGALGSRA
ncbi:MAG: rod shape-determining protein MreD [Rhodobacteraceae bacterium]|nr:rod shape-determining protein MreD [Paracoccaceae bacterium]